MRNRSFHPVGRDEQVLFAIILRNYPLLLDHGVLTVANWLPEETLCLRGSTSCVDEFVRELFISLSLSPLLSESREIQPSSRPPSPPTFSGVARMIPILRVHLRRRCWLARIITQPVLSLSPTELKCACTRANLYTYPFFSMSHDPRGRKKGGCNYRLLLRVSKGENYRAYINSRFDCSGRPV